MALNSTDAYEYTSRLSKNIPRFESFSGADYKFVIHVPTSVIAENKYWLTAEIQDEIWEVENRIDVLLKRATSRLKPSTPETVGNLKTVFSILDSSNSPELKRLYRLRAQLEKALNEARRAHDIEPIALDALQTVSYQIHRDKQPVRALGHASPKGYTSGARLIAGSMICTVVREHPLVKVIDILNAGFDPRSRYGLPSSNTSAGFANQFEVIPAAGITDQLPPLHLTVIAVNESGNSMALTLYGVEFVNDGAVMSIQDILTEDTLSFVAQDIDIMRTLDTRGVLNIKAIDRQVTVSSFLNTNVAAARKQRRGLPF